jgi:peptidoglycan/LPS O-acetylase OafA/YrhL
MTEARREQVKSGYIPTLDGWRALAVLSVVAYHDRLRSAGGFSDSALHRYGFLGVDLFFAISGILICSRLLDEEDTRGRISLRDFYIRRFCRILPPAFLFLAILGLLGAFHAVRVGWAAWLSSLFVVGNYYLAHVHSSDVSLYTNHFWSLAIEEHFYLILPGILCLFPRRRAQVLTVLVGMFLAYSACIHGNAAWLAYFGGPDFTGFRTELRLNSLLFPALLAILLGGPRFRAFCARWIHPVAVAVAILAALFLCAIVGIVPGDWLVIPFAFPFLIVGTMLRPRGIFARLLELGALRFVGRISYSIYLWQQLFFIDSHINFNAAWPLGVLQSAPWNYIATFGIACASYYLVERPFIRLGHRLAPPATEGHRDLAPKHGVTEIASG